MVKKKLINLNELYESVQKEMISNTEMSNVMKHPNDKGDNTENCWIKWFNNYLPKRYKAAKATVIDSNGNYSDQIDVVIYDNQYSITLLNKNEVLYIPAESVYAVFEVKQNMNKNNIEYAMEKAASVRKLKRTSSLIVDVNSKKKKKKLNKIIAGILTTSSDITKNKNKAILKILEDSNEKPLDCGCSLNDYSFFYLNNKILVSDKDNALVSFYLKLIELLQKSGTVPAINIEKYMKNTKFKDK